MVRNCGCRDGTLGLTAFLDMYPEATADYDGKFGVAARQDRAASAGGAYAIPVPVIIDSWWSLESHNQINGAS